MRTFKILALGLVIALVGCGGETTKPGAVATDPRTRREAAEALGEHDTPSKEVVKALTHIASKDADTDVRQQAIVALGKIVPESIARRVVCRQLYAIEYSGPKTVRAEMSAELFRCSAASIPEQDAVFRATAFRQGRLSAQAGHWQQW
jgi:hypothetical protein